MDDEKVKSRNKCSNTKSV